MVSTVISMGTWEHTEEGACRAWGEERLGDDQEGFLEEAVSRLCPHLSKHVN